MSMLLVLATTSCLREDAPAPAVSVTLNNNVSTIKAGGSIRITPNTGGISNLIYRWKLNGQPAGTDSFFVFNAAERGTYTISVQVTGNGGMDTASMQVQVLGVYENGFFILNEGWFGTETGSVFYYYWGADTVVPWVCKKENTAFSFGDIMSTVQYGAVHDGKLYVVVKVGGPLVVFDAYSMKETGRINSLPDNNGQTFLGIDQTRGLIGAGDGLYPVDLGSLTIGSRIAGVTGLIGNMVKSGDRIFVHSQQDGIVVLDANNYNVIGKPTKATTGPVVAKSGTVQVMLDSYLVGIQPQTLALDSVQMPFTAVEPWGAWRSVTMTASTTEDAIYVVEPGMFWQYGTKLYKYVRGNNASVSAPFITTPDGEYFYGAGVAYDAAHNELVITTINGAYTGDVNRVHMHDAGTGALRKTITYEGWYFPAMIVFQ